MGAVDLFSVRLGRGVTCKPRDSDALSLRDRGKCLSVCVYHDCGNYAKMSTQFCFVLIAAIIISHCCLISFQLQLEFKMK